MKWKRLTASLAAVTLLVPALGPGGYSVSASDFTYEPLTVPNGSFEQASDGYPGWTTVPAMPAEGLHVEIRQDRASEGTNSLYMTDSTASKSLEVMSELIPITPGETYSVTSDIYVEAKSVRMYLRFKKSGSSTDLSGSANTVLANKAGVWDTVKLEGVAPADAEFAQITFYYGASGVGTLANIDNVRLERKIAADPLELVYDSPVMIGDAVSYALSQSAAYGIGPDGNWEQYVTTVGSPVSFHVVDAVTGELKFTQPIAGSSDTIWAIAKGSDGNMYFSSNGVLYRYVVAERKIEALGENPSNKQVFDLKASNDGKLYGGTYSNTNMGRVFEYDIASGEFTDLGVIKEGQQYVRGLGVTDDYVYAGIGTTAHVMRINRETKEITEIVIPGISGTSKTISEVDVYGGKLFAYSGDQLYVLDEATGAYVTTIEFQTKISPPSPHQPNLIYYKLDGELYTYDLTANVTAKVEGIPELPADTAVKSHAWITPDSGPFAGRTVLAGMAAFGESFLYDPIRNEYAEHAADVPASPTTVNALETDGRYLYIGGYQRGMSIYDTQTGQFVYSNKEFHQPEGIGFLGGAVYFGTYSGAVMYRLDMSKPFSYSELGGGNPGMALNIEELQDRPFTMTEGDGKLFIGTFPTYGQLGGALTIAEETAGASGVELRAETFANIVPNQSLFGLAYHDGKVFGGTSVWGGLGVTPTEAEAKLFVFDTATKQVTASFTPEIPGVDGEVKLIGELSVGPDGLIWGILDGFVSESAGYDAAIFAMNPDTLEIVKSKVVTASPYNTSKYRPYYIRWGEDGLMYTTIGRKLIAIDPEDLRSAQVIPGTVNLMAQTADGSLYYAQGSKLHKVPVQLDRAALTVTATRFEAGSSVDASVQVLLKNGEQAALGGATVSYVSSDEAVVSVAGSRLTGVAPGTADISATVTLDGRTLTTETVTVTVAPRSSAPGGVIVVPPPADPAAPVVEGDTIKVPAAGAGKPLDRELIADLLKEHGRVVIDSESGALLPLTPLAEAEASSVIDVQVGGAAWTLPISSFPFDRWSSAIGKPADEIYARVEVELAADAGDSSGSSDASLLSPVYTFSLSLVDKDGKVLLTPDASELYSERRFPLPETDLAGAVLMRIDPMNGALRHVPSRLTDLDSDSESDSEARFWSSGSGSYAFVQAGQPRFGDTGGHWADAAIHRMAGRSIVNGISESSFEPQRDISRAELAALFNRGIGLLPSDTIESGLSDLSGSEWFAGEIGAAVSAGVISGYTDGTFKPDRPVTRAEAAAMIGKALALAGHSADVSDAEAVLAPFADADKAGEWALPWLALAVGEGLMHGRGDGSLQPDAYITRAEAAVLLERMLQLAGYIN
ncbi:S-layer homology domain-containing protein [Paenibacillus nanensis]|nr:S-layer homology domain-containing protein [Paenibacillus nanensis]